MAYAPEHGEYIRFGSGEMLNRKIALIAGCLMLAACTSASHAEHKEFVSAKHLYGSCKDALEYKIFSQSYCAAYIEGYIAGASTFGAYVLGKASNQEEILAEAKNRKCSSIDLKNKRPVIEVAKYFVNWINKHQEIIEHEPQLIEGEAYMTLHTIFTDVRFCN